MLGGEDFVVVVVVVILVVVGYSGCFPVCPLSPFPPPRPSPERNKKRKENVAVRTDIDN